MPNSLSKTVINFWLDTLLLVTFLALCWMAIVLRYVFPPPAKADGWTLWGVDYVSCIDVQFGLLCALAAEVLLHVMLHWSWVCGVIKKWRRDRHARRHQGAAAPPKTDDGSQTLWGVGLLIAVCNVVGLAIAAAALSIQGPTP